MFTTSLSKLGSCCTNSHSHSTFSCMHQIENAMLLAASTNGSVEMLERKHELVMTTLLQVSVVLLHVVIHVCKVYIDLTHTLC